MPVLSRNKEIARRWFSSFWGAEFSADIVNELCASDMTLIYSLYDPRRGVNEVTEFMQALRTAFVELSFRSTSDITANGDCVVCEWEGAGIYSNVMPINVSIGSLPEPTLKKMVFRGATVLRLHAGKIAEEIRLDDAETSLRQLIWLTGTR